MKNEYYIAIVNKKKCWLPRGTDSFKYETKYLREDTFVVHLVGYEGNSVLRIDLTGHGTRQITLQQDNARLDVAKEAKNIIVLWTGKSSGLRY